MSIVESARETYFIMVELTILTHVEMQMIIDISLDLPSVIPMIVSIRLNPPPRSMYFDREIIRISASL